MDISDSRLLNLMQRGDTDALGVLYVRYSAQVRNFAMGFLQNEGDADDVTHDVFVNLWQQRDEISDIESLKAYLFTMTRNAIFSIFRHRRRGCHRQGQIHSDSRGRKGRVKHESIIDR